MIRQNLLTPKEYWDLVRTHIGARFGRHHAVIRRMERLYSKNLESVELHKMLARAYEAIGELAKAHTHLEKGLQIEAHDWEARRAIETLQSHVASKNAETSGNASSKVFLRRVPQSLRERKSIPETAQFLFSEVRRGNGFEYSDRDSEDSTAMLNVCRAGPHPG